MLTTFIDKQTTVTATWLNGIDQTVNGVLQGATNPGQILQALGLGGGGGSLPILVSQGGTSATDPATALANLGGVSLAIAVPAAVAAAIPAINPTPTATTAEQIAITASGGALSIVNPQWPVLNVARYGISATNTAAVNTPILKALMQAGVNGPRGLLVFPNVSGIDTYQFNVVQMQIRSGIHIDLQGCTLTFTGAANALPANIPMLQWIMDFRLENGYININHPATNNSGGLRGGSRYNDGIGWPGFPLGILDQDDLLSQGKELQGTFVLSNLHFSYNNLNQSCITLIGGLRDIEINNVWIDGASSAFGGIYYEYGFASLNGQPSVPSAWTTSHCNNVKLKNIYITNIATTGSNFGVGANGAGNFSCENIYVNGAGIGMVFGAGEAAYFRMWTPDGAGGGGTLSIPRLIKIRNVLLTTSVAGIQHSGAANVGGGFMAPAINALPTPQRWQAQTDYLNLDLSGFRIYCDLGINFTGATCTASNGVIQGVGIGSSGGIFLGADAIHINLEKIQILNCNAPGIRGNVGFTIWGTKRPQFFRIADCFIAGNTAGIQLDYCQSAIIENNQIGYNTIYNVQAETTQSIGINIGLNCLANTVICVNNFTSVPAGGAAYSNIGPQQTIQGEHNPGYVANGNWIQWTPQSPFTGWGTSIGATIVPNFNASTATLTQCGQVIAYLITILQRNGLMGP